MRARLVLVLAGILTALVALEVGLRVLGVETASYHSIAGFTVYDAELGWRLAPARTTVFKGAHFSVTVTHNAEGLRDRSYAYERAPGRRRILVLGDSSVWCWGVEQDDCFTERLEARLPDTDVINAGVPGYSTGQEVLFYEREGRRYRADLVLLLLSPNDVADNVAPGGPRFRLEDGRLVLGGVPVPRRKSAVDQWLQEHSRLFAHVSYLAAALEQGRVRRRHAAEAPPRALPELTIGDASREGIPHPAATARMLEPAATSAPSPTTAASSAASGPPADEVRGEAWLLTAALLDRLAADVRADGATLLVVSPIDFEPMRSWFRDVAATRRIPYLDVVPALWAADRPDARVRLEGDPHLAAPGQVVLADEILAFLARAALLPAAGARTP